MSKLNSNGSLCVACLAMWAAGAHAQDTASAPRIEEIVVTAQKRAESLQDVPLSVTALTAKEIERSRVESLPDVAARTPNFTIGLQNPSEPELTIRGIGSSDREAGSDRSVTVFVDEVYIGRASASTFDLFDLERIEVLRGPQGTLFGRNVVGGAVSLVTAKPTAYQEGKLQLTLGTDGLRELRGMFNQPIGDSAALRIAASGTERDGYFYNQLLDRGGVGAPSSRNVRAHLDLNPTDRLNVLLSLDYATDKLDGVVSRITQGAASDADFAAAMGVFGNYRPPQDLFTVGNNVYGSQDRDILGTSARFTYTTDAVEVTFLPAYRTTDYFSDRDLAGIPITGSGAGSVGFNSREIIDEQYDAASAELRFASANPDARLRWVGGLYYLDEDVARQQIRERQLNNQYSRPLFDQENLATSAAIFGQATYALTDRLRLTAGARYTKDKKDFALTVENTLSPAEIASITTRLGRAPTLNPASDAFSAAGSDSWAEVTPKLALDFSVTDDFLLYASASEGFKSGGFNGLGATAALARSQFDPETARNYEIGSKSTLWEGRLQVNLAAFQLDFQDLQLRDRRLTIPGDESSAIVNIINAAEARIRGAELEFILMPVDRLTLSGYLSHLDTEITDVVEGSTTIVGSVLPRAPAATYGLTAGYEIPLGTAGTIGLRASYRSTGKQYYDINEPPASEEPRYGLLDLRLGFDSLQGNWGLALWCKNATDEEYRSHVQQILSGRAAITQIGAPRRCGLTFNKDFGDAP